MQSNSQEFLPIALLHTRAVRHMDRQHSVARSEHAAPEAFDEIFAHLADRQDKLERAGETALDARRFRDTAAEMDRQHGRLAQLLRDIDLSA